MKHFNKLNLFLINKFVPLLLLIISASIFVLSSCDSEKIDISDDLLNTCDDTTAVTYNNTIHKLIQRKCIDEGCHCPSCPPGNFKADVFLDQYVELKKYAINGDLLKKVKPGNPPQMPYGLPGLSECDIRKIERWVKNGAPE